MLTHFSVENGTFWRKNEILRENYINKLFCMFCISTTYFFNNDEQNIKIWKQIRAFQFIIIFEKFVRMFLVQATLSLKSLFGIIREVDNQIDLLQLNMNICFVFVKIARRVLSTECLFLMNRKKNTVILMKMDNIDS